MRLSIIAFIAILLAAPVYADLQMDNIQFDPAIIASGDEVDIVAQFRHTGLTTADDRIGNPDYTFQVRLEPDDDLSRDYVRITDSEGRDLQGIITRGDNFNKRFRVKVADDAPAGNYELRIVGQWYRDGQPIESSQYLRFSMPVKKEGIVLSIANVVSMPEKVRSGDKEVLLSTSIVNTGEKTAKNIRVTLRYPEGISSAYTNNNDLYVGTLAAGAEQSVTFYVDTARFIKEGVYDIGYTLSYEDLDNNQYTKSSSFPFVIKKKPNIVVVASNGTGLAGDDITLRVTVENKGEETADAVDIRILKQSSQPFEMDVRSDYLGRMMPGETATAVFTLNALRDAEEKEHSFTVLVRAKGDSEEGDDNVYTYTDSVSIDIVGERENRWPMFAAAFAGIVAIGAGVSMMRKK
jgi:hypothetical protein